MDADFDNWHRVMRNKWTKMKELRSQTRGGERQSPRTADATTQTVERKRKEAEARRAATGKRKHGES
jgi:hypothetical protein